MTLSGMSVSRFDWYEATLPADAPLSGVDLLVALGDERPVQVPGRNGYATGWEIRREGSRLATVLVGRGVGDHVVATGADSPEVAERVRRFWPGHGVSRADVCLDFVAGPDFYARTRNLLAVGLTGRVSTTKWSQTTRQGQESETFYAGSRKSEVRVRLYEKGKEDPQAYAPDTVRLEVQVRPQKDRKGYAASLAPEGFWGMARWSRWVAEAVCGLSAPAAPARSARVSDLDRALDTMVRQYRGRLLELLARVDGDLDLFTSDLLGRVYAGEAEGV